MRKFLLGTLTTLLTLISLQGKVYSEQGGSPLSNKEYLNQLGNFIQVWVANHSKSLQFQAAPVECFIEEDSFSSPSLQGGESLHLYCVELKQEKQTVFGMLAVRFTHGEGIPVFLYTADQKRQMPSLELFLDVLNFPFFEYPDWADSVHLVTEEVRGDGSYSQTWIIRDAKGEQELSQRILFSPDGKGGTFFSLKYS